MPQLKRSALPVLTLAAAVAACFPQLRDLPTGFADLEVVAGGDILAAGDLGFSDGLGVTMADTALAATDTTAVPPGVDALGDAFADSADAPGDHPRWVVDKVLVCALEPVPDAAFDYDCVAQETFGTSDAVFVLLSLSGLDAETLRFGAAFFHEGRLAWSWADVFRPVSGWTKASTWPTGSNLAAGTWTVDLFVDIGDGFEAAATVGFTVR